MNSSSPIIITTGARLHFGPLSYGSAKPPLFGGVGLMIDSPGFHIEFRESQRDEIVGPQEHTARVSQLLRLCRDQFHSVDRPPGIQVTIREAIPPHTGFGSGTQLALTIATGVTLLSTGKTQCPEGLAKIVERGRRSAIGIHGFKLGGFLIDAGKNSELEIGSLAAQLPVPDDWRFVLITPRNIAGLFGDDEANAFARLPPMPSPTIARLGQLALMHLLPAVRRADFARFSDALWEFGNTVGEFFAPVQGGVFRHPGMRELVSTMRAGGVKGIAQTSWGPTICVAAESDADANRLASEMTELTLCRNCSIHVARPRNTGASTP